jgi:hypothetical protein
MDYKVKQLEYLKGRVDGHIAVIDKAVCERQTEGFIAMKMVALDLANIAKELTRRIDVMCGKAIPQDVYEIEKGER